MGMSTMSSEEYDLTTRDGRYAKALGELSPGRGPRQPSQDQLAARLKQIYEDNQAAEGKGSQGS